MKRILRLEKNSTENIFSRVNGLGQSHIHISYVCSIYFMKVESENIYVLQRNYTIVAVTAARKSANHPIQETIFDENEMT